MDDKSVILLSRSDYEDVMKEVEATEEEHQRSDGLNGVNSVTTVEEDCYVAVDVSDSQSMTRNEMINKRRKMMNNQVDNDDDMRNEDMADLGTKEVEFVSVPGCQKLGDFIEVDEPTNKTEDVETCKAIHVGLNIESMPVIGKSSISKEEEKTVHLNNSNVDEVMLLTQPMVDAVVEGEHPITVQLLGTDGKQLDDTKHMEMLVMSGTEMVLENSNSVVRKLLRGPRYFNRIDGGFEVCRNCGEEGHNTVMCTSKQRPKPCFVCGILGHSGKKCTKGKVCHHCNGVGHASNYCPNKNEERLPISCLKCGDSGHDMWECNNDFSQDDLKEIQCYICKNFGHLCCAGFPDFGSREVSCCNCGHSGHVVSECKRPKSGTGKYLPCRRCGSYDHRGRRCKKRQKIAAEKAAKAERFAMTERAAEAERAVKAEDPAKVAKSTIAVKVHQKKGKRILGSKSAPYDLYRPKRAINTSYKLIPGAGALQPSSRNESSNIRSNFCHRLPGSNVWNAPRPISQPNTDQTPAYFSPDFLNLQNPFKTLSHPPFSNNNSQEISLSSSSVLYSSPLNISQMLSPFASPAARPYQTTRNYQRVATPYPPPTLGFNSPPVPLSQAYFPFENNQAAASSYASRNYPIPQNPVPRFIHPTLPNQPRFQPPWPGHY